MAELDDEALSAALKPGGGPEGGPRISPNEICDALEDEDVETLDDAEARSFRKVARSVVSCESSLLALVVVDDDELSVCRSELSWLRSVLQRRKRTLELLDDDVMLLAEMPGRRPLRPAE